MLFFRAHFHIKGKLGPRKIAGGQSKEGTQPQICNCGNRSLTAHDVSDPLRRYPNLLGNPVEREPMGLTDSSRSKPLGAIT